MRTDAINRAIRCRVGLDDPEEPLEMIGFTIARYKFACKWIREGERVLEVGCGEGFGCNFLSRHAGSVTGLDIDAEAIGRCRGRYCRENLRFVVDDIVHPRELPAGGYDVVVSFEMIEHVSREDGQRMVANVAGHLRERGMAIVSTPRARADRSVSRQAMHPFEYDYDTLIGTLNPHFDRVMVFCQNDEYIYAGHPSTAWYYVALCFR